MPNVGAGQILVILLVALVVLGPDKLPSAARSFGRVIREVKRVSGGFQQEMRDAMRAADIDLDMDISGSRAPGARPRGNGLHPGLGAGPALPAASPPSNRQLEAPGRSSAPDPARARGDGTFHSDGPSSSFS